MRFLLFATSLLLAVGLMAGETLTGRIVGVMDGIVVRETYELIKDGCATSADDLRKGRGV